MSGRVFVASAPTAAEAASRWDQPPAVFHLLAQFGDGFPPASSTIRTSFNDHLVGRVKHAHRDGQHNQQLLAVFNFIAASFSNESRT